MEYVPLSVHEAPVTHKADVVVVGGGPGGVAAALSAAQAGARVLLIEQYGMLGGMATVGLVNPFMTFFAGQRQIIFGSFQKLLDKLASFPGGLGGPKGPWAFDSDVYARATEELCQEAGIELLFHSYLCDAAKEGETLKAAIYASKSGLQAASAKVFVDATGDADLAALAGCPFEQGRPGDGLTQPMTCCFEMSGVDEERMPSKTDIDNAFKAARARGEVSIPLDWGVLYFYTTHPGQVHFNNTRIVRRHGTDVDDMTWAEAEGRRQAFELAAWMIANITGFEQAHLSRLPGQVGVRESRRIVGDYTLIAEDVTEARKHPDAIACGSYMVDIHDPDGGGVVHQWPPAGDWYDIPYRCLLPQGARNLVIAGRPISSTHEAHSATRVMPIAAAIGDGAGVAAALAAEADGDLRAIDLNKLREQLKAQGAFLGD